MKTVKAGKVTIGEGRPKIIASITGEKYEEIMEEVKCFPASGAEIAEWRADFFNIRCGAEFSEVLRDLKKVLKEIPLLFTYRTLSEGGKGDKLKYEKINSAAVYSGMIDMIDIEAFAHENAHELIVSAQKAGVPVVASSHDFEGTPSKSEIIAQFGKMRDLGADIAKIAITPKNVNDVFEFLSAVREVYENEKMPLLIPVSMTKIGAISRICGEIAGSCATFGFLKNPSAPGQVQVKELLSALEIFHKAFTQSSERL